jgi:hypothetical protein
MRLRALLVAALLAPACGGEASAETLPARLDYARSGGIAGVSERATVRPDGRATLTADRAKPRTVRLARAERDRIARYVRAADLAHVKVSGKHECCDQFSYRIAYRGRTLTWSSAHFPAKLRKLVGALEDLIEKYGGPG